MNIVYTRRYIDALRSGNYRQCRHKLTEHGWIGNKYCAIGLASHLGLDLQLSQVQVCRIVDLNDEKRKSFRQIADFVESELQRQLRAAKTPGAQVVEALIESGTPRGEAADRAEPSDIPSQLEEA